MCIAHISLRCLTVNGSLSVPLKFILLDISEVQLVLNSHGYFHCIAYSSLGDRATIGVGYSMKTTSIYQQFINIIHTHLSTRNPA